MSFAKTYSAQTHFLKAKIVTTEVDLSKGLHAFSIVGLPDKAVEEAKDRISAAIKNTGFDSPKSQNQKVVIALAPAGLKKEGSAFDLSMALAYLLAKEKIGFNPDKKIFLGELSLQGDLRPITGVLPLAEEAAKRGFQELFVPTENAREAALIGNIKIFAANNLEGVIRHLDPKAILAGQKNFLCRFSQEPNRKKITVNRLLICPTSRASRAAKGDWKLPPPAATTSLSGARPAPAKPCWPAH